MKNDITRDTFNPLKHFSRVLMQQGRVQLDADWNEQVSILLHYLRTVTTDLIGPAGGPADRCGFELIGDTTRLGNVIDKLGESLSPGEKSKLETLLKNKDVLIAPGRYYVDGLLAENEQFVSFLHQPGKPVTDKMVADDLEAAGKEVLIYLDVWERHVTPIEDDDIREKALGGPDTATRAKVAWVARARHLTPDEEAARKTVTLSAPPTDTQLANLRKALQPKFEDGSKAQLANRGLLRARIEPQSKSDNPCVTSPESVYRGPENQLYHVEIHRGGSALKSDGTNKSTAATFKWSRDNGSVAAAWLDKDGHLLRVAAVRDQTRGFAKSQWIELSDDRRELEGAPGTLVQLKDGEAGSLTIDPQTTSGAVDRSNFPTNPKVRRWDQQGTEKIALHEGAISIEYDKWFSLEDGVQVRFQAPAPGEPHGFRPGDYWLIPARVATRSVEWSWEKNDNGEIVKDNEGEPVPLALPPHGITHHYALLGLLAATATPLANKFAFTDCRRKFAPIAPVV